MRWSQPVSFTAPVRVNEEEEGKEGEEKTETSVGDLRDPDVDQNILLGRKNKRIKKGSNNGRIYSNGYLKRVEAWCVFRKQTNNHETDWK